MTTMSVVGECFFWYRLTRVFPDRFHRAVKRLCVCVCVCVLQDGSIPILSSGNWFYTVMFFVCSVVLTSVNQL